MLRAYFPLASPLLMALWVENVVPAELFSQRSQSELMDVIRSTYRQVLGNAHLHSCERCTQAESQLCNGSISVREFVAAVGLSDTYRQLFYAPNGQYRFIELNFKHFLGRAPRNQAEISEHVLIWNTHGYEAEILSYVDSDEYKASFGEDIVPHPRTDSSRFNQNKDYLRTLNLDRGFAGSDRGRTKAQIRQIAGNLAAAAKGPRSLVNAPTRTTRYELVYDLSKVGAMNRRVSRTIRIEFSQLTRTIQSLQRRGGSIRSITPVA